MNFGIVDHTADGGVIDGQVTRRRLSAHAFRVILYATLLLSDFTAVIGAFLIATALLASHAHSINILFITLPMYFLVAFNSDAFTIKALKSSVFGMSASLRSLFFAFSAFFLICFFLAIQPAVSRLLMAVTMAGSVLLLFAARQVISLVLRYFYRDRFLAEMLIIDGGKVLSLPNFVTLDAERECLRPDLRDPMMLDLFASMIKGMDRVVISCSADRMRAWAMMLKGANIRGEVLAHDFDMLGVSGISKTDEYTTLTVAVGPLNLRNRIIKRAFDIVFSLSALLALAPVFLIVSLAIKLDSKGPIFFKQRRVGRGNAFFQIFKFRSMRVESSDSDGKVSTRRYDNRITRVGYFIRRTSIDELPQLLNVLFGSMSVVGPRPHALGSLAGEQLFWDIDERYWHRHALKPGITGLAQVRGFRGATVHRDDLTRRLQADLEYATKWSLWRDLSIVASTLKVVVHHNTY